MFECDFRFGRNNAYRPSAIETDMKATAFYEKYFLDLGSFAAAPVRPSVFWKNS